MPRVYQSLVEATTHKSRKEIHAVRPKTPSSAPHEPHPPAGDPAHTEAANIEADTSHADADANADIVLGPIPGTHPPMTMISPHHQPYQISCPHLSVDQPEEGIVLPFLFVHSQ
jgi:hypothetical protein